MAHVTVTGTAAELRRRRRRKQLAAAIALGLITFRRSPEETTDAQRDADDPSARQQVTGSREDR